MSGAPARKGQPVGASRDPEMRLHQSCLGSRVSDQHASSISFATAKCTTPKVCCMAASRDIGSPSVEYRWRIWPRRPSRGTT